MIENKRKGARSIKEIPKEILKQLDNGEIESANLVEWLAVDQKHLLENMMTEWKIKDGLLEITNTINALKKQTVITVNETIGAGLLNLTISKKDNKLLSKIIAHPSDAVRCWGTYMIGRNEAINLKEKLSKIQILAADLHFGVREIAWMAVRPTVANNLKESIKILCTFTKSKDENIRRFASELTRPRGVWCEHISSLKEHPELALPILEPLKSDPSKYVQDSVGNWLNDASKTKADFVKDLCKKWAAESPTKETSYILKKALRTIEK